jgi:hypothetical protein
VLTSFRKSLSPPRLGIILTKVCGVTAKAVLRAACSEFANGCSGASSVLWEVRAASSIKAGAAYCGTLHFTRSADCSPTISIPCYNIWGQDDLLQAPSPQCASPVPHTPYVEQHGPKIVSPQIVLPNVGPHEPFLVTPSSTPAQAIQSMSF